ncbi:26S proteasome regulatory subunit [Recurvomyces mirabilis]|uniref:26S proteasome regulatory subunit n=1 Tax=Recurvomyces mirabilis TaxID=574656 RepID=A0AAE0WSE5_9PEZI|nr:26S proteasome regulatory subunit [Recurvomyces mirabilis]KAK5159518.1 26S proteasome regulatory subunit [Recurvomyces mirabilis]
MDNAKVSKALQGAREKSHDDLQHYFLSFEDYWERKLWHELTDILVEYYHEEESKPQRIELYEGFVKAFADKINQLKLVVIGLQAAGQCKDDKTRLDFLATLAKRVNKPTSQDAYVLALSRTASVRLSLSDKTGARTDLDTCEKTLENFDSVENVVHASFYRVSADYYQQSHSFASYYRTMLLYLACVDLATLAPKDRQRIAYDLSIAALVSETIYNFGELLLHPILESLAKTEHDWLRDLLFAFNRGDLHAYQILQTHLRANSLLQTHQTFLYQKISLAALTQLVFSRSPQDRAMTFTTISEETKVQPDEIEHLIMKALSLGLLRGSIDQVEEVARITWVQPKVLERGGIEAMRERLREWDAGVERLGHYVEGVGKEVWAA